MKRKKMWLTRDKRSACANPLTLYKCYIKKRPTRKHNYLNGRWNNYDRLFCSDLFESIAPPELHLEPGGGPIPIRLERGHPKS